MIGDGTQKSKVLFGPAGALQQLTQGPDREGIAGAVVVHEDTPAIGVAVSSA
jgi:hypothetical protein